jgi:hypothetical protein
MILVDQQDQMDLIIPYLDLKDPTLPMDLKVLRLQTVPTDLILHVVPGQNSYLRDQKDPKDLMDL